MQTPDGASYVLIYQWIDPLAREFNDKEEAFYIDGINENNATKAKKICKNKYNEYSRQNCTSPIIYSFQH